MYPIDTIDVLTLVFSDGPNDVIDVLRLVASDKTD